MSTILDTFKTFTKYVKLAAHPVGSIYISTDNTSPDELFGGTWEQIQDTFLWCAGSSHAAGTTGGEETHQLSVAEMPAHQHTVVWWTQAGTSSNATQYYQDGSSQTGDFSGIQVDSSSGTWQSNPLAAQSGYGDAMGNTWASGLSYAHNNMPPYLSVYAWKRTA